MSNVMSIEERQDRDEDFVRYYVQLGGNATEAARQIGVGESSASTTGNRMKQRLWKEIEEEIADSIKTHVPMALNGLVKLAEGATSESVRLNAVKDLLDRGGLKPTEKQEIHQVNEYENMTVEEMTEELDELHDRWLQDYLTEHNLKVVPNQIVENVEAVLEHKLEQFSGKKDH